LSNETLGKFSVTKEMKEVETIISADRPPADKVVDLSEHLANYAKSREEAKSILSGDESEQSDGLGPLKKSATNRDLPNTASRFATYLGHSLGYTNLSFLNDLAVSAICHFGRKNGASFEEKALPPLAKLLQDVSAENDAVILDARDILAFLEIYLEDPDCDRTEKDFALKVFHRAAESALKDQKIAAWNLKCWSAFIEGGGPNVDTYSVCNRAAASALKFARTYTLN